MAGGGIVTPSIDETDPFIGGPGDYKSSYNTKEKLKCYRDNVKATASWREAEGYDELWKRMRDLYALKMDKMGMVSEDSIAVAISFATINVIAPSVSVNHPKITVHARKEDDNDASAIVEVVVNYWWKHYNIQPEFRRAVKDFLVYGLGVLKVGYRYEELERDLTDEEKATEVAHSNAQLDDFANENPDMAPHLPDHGDVFDLIPETTQEIVHDAPFVERISPLDFFVDPEATCLDDAKYIAQRVVLPLERVKQDQRYNKKATKGVVADSTVRWHAEDAKRNVPTPEGGRVTIWEYYDTESKEFSVFVDSQDLPFLVDPRPYPYPFGLPFVLLENYDVPDRFYPIGELEAIETLQYELNETRSAMVQARKLDIPKFLSRKNALNTQAKTALASNRPNTVIEIDDDRPLADVLAAMPRNDANAQLYQQHSEVIEGDINLVTGVTDYQRGGQSELKRTATEASIIQDSANARAADKLATIEHGISEVARRLVQLAQHYMEGDAVARIVGPSGATMWVPYNASDIEGEFDYDVEGGSTQPQNETFKRQQAMQLLQTLQPFVPMGIINLPELLTQVLRDGFGMKNPEKLINQAPPPQIDPNTGQPIDPNAQPQVDPNTGQPLPPDQQQQQGAPPPPPPDQQQPGAQGPSTIIPGVPDALVLQNQQQYGTLATQQGQQA